MWREVEIARLEAGDDPLKPSVVVIADEHLAAPEKEKVRERLSAWLAEIIGERLKPLVEIDAAQDIAGLARGIAFRLKENFGVLRRESVAEEIRSLDQPARAQLRKYGVRFGAFNIYFPDHAEAGQLGAGGRAVGRSSTARSTGSTSPPCPSCRGRGSPRLPPMPPRRMIFYGVAGFHVCGPRAVRVDMLERLADLIRVLLTWRADPANPGTPPKGATGDGGFRATPEMMSILGCSAGELGNVLKALGFWAERRKLVPAAGAQPAPEPVSGWLRLRPTASDVRHRPTMRAAGRGGRRSATVVVEVAGSAPEDSRAALRSGRSPLPRQSSLHRVRSRRRADPWRLADNRPEAAVSRRVAAVRRCAPAVGADAEQWEEVWRPRRKGRAFEAAPERHKQQGQRPRHAHQGARLPRAGAESQQARAATCPAAGQSQRESAAAEQTGAGQSRSTARTGTDARNGAAVVPTSGKSGRVFPCMPRRPSRRRQPSIPIRRSRR